MWYACGGGYGWVLLTESEFTVDGNNILLSFVAFLVYIGITWHLVQGIQGSGLHPDAWSAVLGTPKKLVFKALLFHLMLVATDHILQNMLQCSVQKLLYKCLLIV